MKCAAIAVSTILVASLGIAGEVTVQPTTTAKDSPLVQAAKTTNRSKKRIVITNDSLKGSTGHITTTKSQPPVYQPPKMTEAEYQSMHPVKPKEEKAAEAKKAEAADKKQQRLERLAADQDDPYSELDPAMLEHQLDKNAQQAPKQEQKKP